MLPGTKNLKDRPDLQALVDAARARYEALSPLERAIADMETKRSGMIGLSKMSTPREQIEARIDAMPEYVVLAELKRLLYLERSAGNTTVTFHESLMINGRLFDAGEYELRRIGPADTDPTF